MQEMLSQEIEILNIFAGDNRPDPANLRKPRANFPYCPQEQSPHKTKIPNDELFYAFYVGEASEYAAENALKMPFLFRRPGGPFPPLTCSSLRRWIATGSQPTRNIYTRYKTNNELSYAFYVGVAFRLHSTNYSNTLSKCRKCYLRRQKS